MEFLEKLLNLGDEVKNAAPLSERIVMGLETAFLGMGVIFMVLIILWAVLSIFKLVFYRPASNGKKIKDSPEPEIASESILQEDVRSDDGELVAAITAAISVMIDKPETSFRVVSFRRTASK